METTLGHLQYSLAREKERSEYLERMIKIHADHLWNDVKQELSINYPRGKFFDYDRDLKPV